MKIINFAVTDIGNIILLYDDGTMYQCCLAVEPRKDGTGADLKLVDPEPIALPLGPN